MSKESRISELEEQVDDLVHEIFCELNKDNLKRRVSLLENFKGDAIKSLEVANQNFKTQREDLNLTRELYERLGQKIKDQNDLLIKGQARQALTILNLMEYLGLEFNEGHEVVKIKKVIKKKNAKSVSTPKKNNRRKAK